MKIIGLFILGGVLADRLRAALRGLWWTARAEVAGGADQVRGVRPDEELNMAETTKQIDRADIHRRTIDIVAEQMGIEKDEVKLSTEFRRDLATDSLDEIELIMEFEDEFEIDIPDGDADSILTVGQAIDYVASKLSQA